MKKAQAELAETEVEGQAGNGLVKVVMTCGHQVRKLDISSELIEQAADDKELLEDLLLAAFADAGAKWRKPLRTKCRNSPRACRRAWATFSNKAGAPLWPKSGL